MSDNSDRHINVHNMIETGGRTHLAVMTILLQNVKLPRALLTKHCTVKVVLCFTKHCAVKTYGRSDYTDACFLDLSTIGGEWSALSPGCFTPDLRSVGRPAGC
jgi:hypothetical protein